jgi:hypothetical protein
MKKRFAQSTGHQDLEIRSFTLPSDWDSWLGDWWTDAPFGAQYWLRSTFLGSLFFRLFKRVNL